MGKLSCFSVLVGRKKKSKGDRQYSEPLNYSKEDETLQVKLLTNPDTTELMNSTPFSVSLSSEIQKNSKVMSADDILRAEAVEVDYQGSDEGDDDSPVKRDLSGLTLQSRVVGKELLMSKSMGSNKESDEVNDQWENESEKEAEVGDSLLQSGHVSDPGMGKTEFSSKSLLKRSCSNLETSDMLKRIADQLPPSKSHSFEDLQNLAEKMRGEVAVAVQGSPVSVMTSRSADKVMLKKHSSSQVLPSKSRRLWWKLLLWSHRNLQQPLIAKTRSVVVRESSNQEGGYCSDTLEPSRLSESTKLKSPESFTEGSSNDKQFHKWGDFNSRFSGFWPQNQWVAFPAESSSLKRVDEWVNNLEAEPPLLLNDEENDDAGISFPPSPDNGETSSRAMTPGHRQLSSINLSDEVLHANTVIQSLNSSSTIAHISDMSLKVIPTMSHFSRLRSVNLSGNCIVRIAPGSLPKGLHTLNLSRNRIVTIEGLRELTRLRVLDLSYNKISRIGHGLSKCTLIKELYLAGNKISDLEGLHRLLKLTVLDLSFNKVSTAKTLGQLVANYNSLLALNLLGNPIQSNIGDDQLRKVISEDEREWIPTKHNIRRGLEWLINGCKSGDSLVFHYSGHGSQQINLNGDEMDGFDETLCPLDYETEGMIIDDEINATIVRPLPTGATLHAIIDSCHSGTVLDLPYLCRMNQNGYYVWEDHNPPSGAYKGTSGGLALTFSACDDHQTSADTSALSGSAMTGAMTYSFIQALQSAPGLTYGVLLNAMRSAIRDAKTGIRFNGPISSYLRKMFRIGLLQEPQLTSSEKFDIYRKAVVL